MPRFFTLLTAVALLAPLAAAHHVARAQTPPPTLSDFFKPGVVFQDRNGDGAVDFVAARIALADKPAPGETLAAASVAARLGHETSAMTLPVPRLSSSGAAGRDASSSDDPIVFVGAKSVPRSVATADALGVAALKPGDGLVMALAASGKPAIALLGGDDAGLMASTVTFARLPFLGDRKGPTTDSLAEDVRQFLAGKGIGGVTAASMLLVKGTDGIDRATVDVQLTGGDFIKAQVALNQFKATATRDASRPLSYPMVRELRIRLRSGSAPAASIDLPRSVAPDPPSQAPARRPGAGAKDALDLSSFYTIDGAFGDSDNNLIPDRLDALLSADGDGTDGVVDLAARMGLESTGVSIPIAKPPKAITAPESEPTLVLIGQSHPATEPLIKSGKWQRPMLEPGEGLIQVVKKAFGEKSAVIVTGGDAAGVNRAVEQLAERFPHIWSRGKDRTSLDDVEEDVRKFVAGRSPAGQAAMGLYKLDKIADQLKDKDLASARVRVFAEKAPAELAAVVRDQAAATIKAPTLNVDVQDLDVQKGRAIINDEFDIPSEVEEFWTKLRARVLPAVKKRNGVTIEARLSEPPEIRKSLEQQARAELVKAGADEKTTAVTILSAYKQGYSWLYDAIRPAIADKGAASITIRFAALGPPAGWKQQGMFVPTRWLLEIYPIDEILSKELSIDPKNIKFEMAPPGSPAYEVIVRSASGSELLRRTFEPKVVERPFFDRFPDYERVRVTTGWIRAEAAGKTLVDERIATDPERFWDHFQAKTLPALYDHVMVLGNGKPRAEDAPFFGELTVDLSLSEPDYRIPVDQEFISSMEAIHEELYFNTLDFFDVMGRFTRGAPLLYPGRVIPLMHPKADGSAGHAKITATGFDAPRPSVAVEYVERNGHAGEIHLDIPKIGVDRPQALAAYVREGRDGISRLDVRIKADTEKDERDALVQRAAEERVDRTVISAEQVEAAVANLGRLRAAGLYKAALAYHDLGELRLGIVWEHDAKPGTELVATLEPNGSPAAWPDIQKYSTSSTTVRSEGAGSPHGLTQWDTPIPPPEAYGILARMSAFKEATVYRAGESYLGKDVWAMDLMPPVEASHWSQAKQTTMKPTVVYSARQHANEVSSTSHVLRLAELLLTDATFREKLNKVNVVIHPI
ncbi:MAG TPA: M14 family zinc carboxypeptidase, partial [Vicinamibacterales bacterium]